MSNRFLAKARNFVVQRLGFPRKGFLFVWLRKAYKSIWSFNSRRIAREIAIARKIFEDLSKEMAVRWDDNGNIGKRYRRQDEAGTPWCVTVDFDTLKDETVTVRDRDTMKQERIKISKLIPYFKEKL